MDISLTTFLVAALAVWRLTHLLFAEEGPGQILVHLRARFGDFWGAVFDCFYCMSLWVSAPFALALGVGSLECGVLWLALSGAACLLQAIPSRQARGAVPAVFFEGEPKEKGHELLRERSPGHAGRGV